MQIYLGSKSFEFVKLKIKYMRLKNPKYLPVLLFSEEHFIVNDLGKLNSMYCRMKDGNYVRSYYEKLGGNIQQEIITKELFNNKKERRSNDAKITS